MNTTSKFLVRALLVVSTLFGGILLCSDFTSSKFSSILILICVFIIFAYATYSCLSNCSKNDIYDIFGFAWLEKKTGINFIED